MGKWKLDLAPNPTQKSRLGKSSHRVPSPINYASHSHAMDSRMRISAVRSHRRLQNSTWEPRDPSAHAAVATRNILKGRAPMRDIGYQISDIRKCPRRSILGAELLGSKFWSILPRAAVLSGSIGQARPGSPLSATNRTTRRPGVVGLTIKPRHARLAILDIVNVIESGAPDRQTENADLNQPICRPGMCSRTRPPVISHGSAYRSTRGTPYWVPVLRCKALCGPRPGNAFSIYTEWNSIETIVP
ncbi:hypothetical protein BKA61DRAFT_580584 [Leptodontidium sp. MPI-SDFR-AT-0119]|nr:hypothetical protein BKA61DRAFT_580584 [Leptodontidium sp. MPI-SDFR-AT-0119]